MKLDLYTRAVLTVIAASLLWLCVQNSAIRAVSAQVNDPARPQRITIVNENGLPLPFDGGIPIRIANPWIFDTQPRTKSK
jgi:hypothetical protein